MFIALEPHETFAAGAGGLKAAIDPFAPPERRDFFVGRGYKHIPPPEGERVKEFGLHFWLGLCCALQSADDMTFSEIGDWWPGREDTSDNAFLKQLQLSNSHAPASSATLPKLSVLAHMLL
jgi:hypothetical protein